MKSIFNQITLAILLMGLIIGLFELAKFIDMAFFYIISLGLTGLLLLGSFEIYERGK